jgi:hypothetical protein
VSNKRNSNDKYEDNTTFSNKTQENELFTSKNNSTENDNFKESKSTI